MTSEIEDAKARAMGLNCMTFVLALGGIMFILLDLPNVTKYRVLAKSGTTIQGRIVYRVYEARTGNKSSTPRYSLVYNFDYDKSVYEGVTKVSTTTGSYYPVGAKLKIRFDPKNPYNSRAEWDMTDNALMMIHFGLALFSCAVLLWGIPRVVRRIQIARLLSKN